ncbi:unnamed protein product, partial [marine sediment metagenome]
YRQRIQGTISPKAYDIIEDERADGRLYNRNMSNALDTIILEWGAFPLTIEAHQKYTEELQNKIDELNGRLSKV